MKSGSSRITVGHLRHFEAAPAVRGARAQATRALRVLRHHRELGGARTLRARGEACLAQVALAAFAQAAHAVDTLRPAARSSPTATTTRHAQRVHADRSEPMNRRAGCGSPASPEPWERRGATPAATRRRLPARASGATSAPADTAPCRAFTPAHARPLPRIRLLCARPPRSGLRARPRAATAPPCSRQTGSVWRARRRRCRADQRRRSPSSSLARPRRGRTSDGSPR